MKNIVITVIKPRPPICIRNIITNLPNIVQCSRVLTTTRPVTQTADVAVKRAFTMPILSPSLLDIGRFNKNVPIQTTAKNPSITILVGFSFKKFFFLPILYIIKISILNFI